MSKKPTPVGGQVLVEYVLVLSLLSVTFALVGPVIKSAILAARARFAAGMAQLP